MSRYIDADIVIKKIESRLGYFNQYYPDHTENIGELEICEEFVNDALSAEDYGEWLIHKAYQGGIEEEWFQCSKCGWENALLIPRNFCPNCGANMNESEEEE